MSVFFLGVADQGSLGLRACFFSLRAGVCEGLGWMANLGCFYFSVVIGTAFQTRRDCNGKPGTDKALYGLEMGLCCSRLGR